MKEFLFKGLDQPLNSGEEEVLTRHLAQAYLVYEESERLPEVQRIIGLVRDKLGDPPLQPDLKDGANLESASGLT